MIVLLCFLLLNIVIHDLAGGALYDVEGLLGVTRQRRAVQLRSMNRCLVEVRARPFVHSGRLLLLP